jgi:hypothetical protein
MDVGINKPLKNYIKQQFDEWLILNRDKKPKRQDDASWIWNRWSEISETIVRNDVLLILMVLYKKSNWMIGFLGRGICMSTTK